MNLEKLEEGFSVDLVEYSPDGKILLSGRSMANKKLTFYLNDIKFGTTESNVDGFWHFRTENDLEFGKIDLKIEFLVKNSKVIGNLFIPENEKIFKYPAAFIGGPMTSVKEQVTGVYAQALAERGFVTLAIDHRYFGESEGKPRQYEKYLDKILDILTIPYHLYYYL